MEISWNFVSPKKWEPWCGLVYVYTDVTMMYRPHERNKISAPTSNSSSFIEVSGKIMELSLNSAFFWQIDELNLLKPVVHGSTWNWWFFWGTESSVAYLLEHQTYNPRASVLLPPKFWSEVNFLANLLSRNLGKTPLFSQAWSILSSRGVEGVGLCHRNPPLDREAPGQRPPPPPPLPPAVHIMAAVVAQYAGSTHPGVPVDEGLHRLTSQFFSYTSRKLHWIKEIWVLWGFPNLGPTIDITPQWSLCQNICLLQE